MLLNEYVTEKLERIRKQKKLKFILYAKMQMYHMKHIEV